MRQRDSLAKPLLHSLDVLISLITLVPWRKGFQLLISGLVRSSIAMPFADSDNFHSNFDNPFSQLVHYIHRLTLRNGLFVEHHFNIEKQNQHYFGS